MAPGTYESVTAFAPATVANIGPGFDVLGMALAGVGDRVTARRAPGDVVRIAAVRGDGGKLPREASANTAGIAAIATLRRAGVTAGVELEIDKGLPIGSGLGSSAASAAAGALAVNLLLGSPLRKSDLIEPCIEAEAAVSGRHADNVAPALLGGLVLVRSVDPLDVLRLPVPEELAVAVVTPELGLSTREARAILPAEVPLAELVRNSANVAALVSACHSGDLALLARAIDGDVVTRARAPLIPGCEAVMEAARDAGALASSISGAGPSVFALCRSTASAQRAAEAMLAAFEAAGLKSRHHLSPAAAAGARRV